MALHVRSTPILVPQITRKSAPYHPSIWGNRFLAFNDSSVVKTDLDRKEEEHLQLLKQEVKKMLSAGERSQQELISLIDDIQRLGLSYHFEAEIDTLLQHLKERFGVYYGTKTDDDLHDVALCFRLLRQQGHNVSSDVFYKFKCSNGKFKENLVKDVKGMLSLFEAAHLRVHGENVLDDALEFTTSHLKEHMKSNLGSPLVDLVGRSLKYPLRKSLNRLVARHYISIYHKFERHNQVLLNMAKTDFNLVQKVHQVELGHLTRWWKDLDFAHKLSFARDRLVECYFWISGVYFELHYAPARIFFTKVISLSSIIDDIYDVYGTIEELQQFTDAIQKWDMSCLDQLPEYMRHCYQPLLDIYTEAQEEIAKTGRPSYAVDYAIDACKELTRGYLKEAKWCQVHYTPTFEEYMSTALVTGGIYMLSVSSFVLMGDVATRESFEWMSKDPLIVRASSVICRLTDDIVGHEFEKLRQHIPSLVECFMKQHGVPKDTACDELQKRITNAWMDMNQECLHPTAAPMPLLARVFNMACVINLLYDEYDGYTHSSTATKDIITSILLDPI
ncbi:sesquiterpene synthase 2-like [Daucus carota subsp. sativus]|uniref:sesquiterpene synthase 2-like n=1 Tax=Daucus carota subsp. sativus TaxID=79200 RepID=UPI0030827E52